MPCCLSRSRNHPVLEPHAWYVACLQGTLPRSDALRLSVRAASALDRARSDRIPAVRESAKEALAVLGDLQVCACARACMHCH